MGKFFDSIKKDFKKGAKAIKKYQAEAPMREQKKIASEKMQFQRLKGQANIEKQKYALDKLKFDREQLKEKRMKKREASFGWRGNY